MSAPPFQSQFQFRFTTAEWASLRADPGFHGDLDNADLPNPRLMGLEVVIVQDHRAGLGLASPPCLFSEA